ncbi:MAG: type II toxin-antitoxin system RelE/ParE family toxin [Succinivibrio sp.]|nr:type II toxin-antitoxin system RelE/ParE family toxin [Succinivibrio sp.]
MYNFVVTDKFESWLDHLENSDQKLKRIALQRLARVQVGNFGDFKNVGSNVLELRIHYGSGYRIYMSQVGDKLLILLCAGNKSSQSQDIEQAKQMLMEYLNHEDQRI